MTARIQFRESPEVVRYLESKGLNPNEVARRAFEAEVRRLRAEDQHRRILATRVRLDRPAAELVREDRDRGHST